MEEKKAFIYIVSDGTGETAAIMIRAAVVQYANVDFHILRNKNVRCEAHVDSVVNEAFKRGALIVHTVVTPTLRTYLEEKAAEKNLLQIDLLGPDLKTLYEFLNFENKNREAGKLRSVDERYFRRVEAIEFSVKHDDGKVPAALDQADIVLVGISRTSKTPLSLFLGYKGWRVANVPLVKGTPLPDQIFEIDQRKIVGLTIDPSNLQKIRKNRLEKFGQDPGGEYASLDNIYDEIEYAKQIFQKHKRWPVFNVTDRALEETASEITRIVCQRMGIKNKNYIF
ncbi:MAG: kinase/pyrophosphorylase [Bdellovibrionales bacterium]|nr:kinase/pyrophosphorylase [Bdellovibrionales bacterium]NQZ19338.1 kinase/pyrophosphorylase [Bdellovibrionales bacterium]